ncbi:MAG: helix-turn-helix transcriptional regulator [Jatrophihabitans sp.]|uniref:helix-turn-helix transcriptional regulator n=1 Tax=Jatrophihabitans sp. TaxID=1932789 RepID=UPI003F7E80C6
MRASRLLSILLTLHARGQASASELAAELEVSVRTIYRDIEALGEAGIPVYATRGRHGGVRLLEGYRTRLTGLSPDEADALFLAGLPGAASDLGLGDVLATTRLKLLAALPDGLRDRAARIRDTVLVDAPGWQREPERPPFLPVLAEATWTTRRVRVRYERSNRAVVDRVLEPLGLVLKAGTWYVLARADGGGEPRTYRVSRVLTAAVQDEVFARPAGFDLARSWSDYQQDYTERLYRAEASVRLDATGRDLLFLVGTVPQRRARDAMGPVDDTGWAETVIPIESVRHGHHALLQLGEHVEVLGPPDLRAAFATTAAELARRYAAG